MLRKLLTDTGGFPSRYSAAIVTTGIVLALIARFNGIPLWKEWLWKIVFFILAFTCILGILFATYLAAVGVYFSSALLISGAMLLAPALHQIYKYSYKSPEIWSTVQKNKIKQGTG